MRTRGGSLCSRIARRARLGFLGFVAMALGSAALAQAHESRPASLEIRETVKGRWDVSWRAPVLAGLPLPVWPRLPAEVRNLTTPTVRELSDSVVERRLIEVGNDLEGMRIDFVGLEATITDVFVRIQWADGRVSTTLVNPSRPWVEVAVRQKPATIVATYLLHGIQHIALGADHLLFVLGLLLLVANGWTVLKTVTAFTVAHSLTLAIVTLGYASPPEPLLHAAVAASILFLGPEIVRFWRGQTSLTIRHPWVVAFLFGLVHGFGFAGALTGAGLPRAELPLALLSFNLGIEIGQIAFVAMIFLLERSFRQLDIAWPAWTKAMPAYGIGSLGAFWTIQRTGILLGVSE